MSDSQASLGREPAGFVISRPVPEDKGDSVIFITRPSAGPFATAGTAIFAVDSVEVGRNYVVAFSDAGRITFSKDLPFLVVPRKFTHPVTTTEMAQMQLTEKKEYEAVFEADEAGGEPNALAHGMGGVEVLEDGRVKTGQYL